MTDDGHGEPGDARLVAQGLKRSFGGAFAVNGLSLDVRAGEIVGLLGPNGAGKTTTLRMLAGVLVPHGGKVEVAGLDMTAAPLAAKKQIGFLSGDTQLYQRLSPREVLVYFGRLYGMEEKGQGARLASRVEALVAELEMADYADRPCGTLSAGQRQRANIARAFLHDPEVLILDEPTNALDIVSGRFVVDALRRARKNRKAVLFSTHVMSEAEYLCDRIYLMHAGKTIGEGTLADLLARTETQNLTDAFLRLIGRA